MISVVIPIHNSAPYIEECLAGILNQTVQDVEIVCVDDASTDNTNILLKNLMATDTRIKLICHEVSKGAGAARNTGVINSTGEYIFFMDSDDIIARSDALEMLLRYSEEDKADLVHGRIVLWDDNTDELKESYMTPFQHQNYHAVSLRKIPLLAQCVTACNILFRRSFLEAKKIKFNETLRKYEDNAFMCQALSLASKITFLQDLTYFYRQRKEGSIMSTHSAKDAFILHSCADDIIQFLFRNKTNYPFQEIYFPHIKQLIN